MVARGETPGEDGGRIPTSPGGAAERTAARALSPLRGSVHCSGSYQGLAPLATIGRRSAAENPRGFDDSTHRPEVAMHRGASAAVVGLGLLLASVPTAARGQGAKPATFPEPNQYDPNPA